MMWIRFTSMSLFEVFYCDGFFVERQWKMKAKIKLQFRSYARQAGSHMLDESEERNWHARADNNSRGSESSKNEWNKLDYTMELSIILYRTRVGMLVSTPNGVVVTYILARPSINHSSFLSCIAMDLGEYFIWRERKWTTKMNNKRKIYLSSASALPMHYTISWNITLPKNQILVGPKQSPGNHLM